MPAKAVVSPMLRWRLAIIAGMCLWWTQAAFRDGLHYYPLHNQQVELFEKTQKDFPNDWQTEWPKIAKEHGWSEENPGAKKAGWDIGFQIGSASVTAPIGLFFLINFLASFKRWVATDEAGVLSSNGQVAKWATIHSLDKTKWKTKGIAKVNYREDGVDKRIILDDWKYERVPIETMVAEVEAHIKPEQVIGGPPTLTPTEIEAIEKTEGIPPTHQG